MKPSTKTDQQSNPEMKERDVQIGVRLSQSEHRKFIKLAESRYMTISELVRQVLHKEADASEKNGKAA